MIKAVFSFVWMVLVHKWYVLRAGFWSKASLWLLLKHDWTKFTLAELPAYSKQFAGVENNNLSFQSAWNHHQKHNPHHWEYWVPLTGHIRAEWPGGQPLPIPEKYVREMVADWFGASRAASGRWPTSLDQWEWYQANIDRILLHPDTAVLLCAVINEAFANKALTGH